MRPQPVGLPRSYIPGERLPGKTAVIPGGGGGIGRWISILFASEGANVVLAHLNEHEDAQETMRLVQTVGGECLLIRHPRYRMDGAAGPGFLRRAGGGSCSTLRRTSLRRCKRMRTATGVRPICRAISSVE